MSVVGELSVPAESFRLGRALGEQDVRIELERTIHRASGLSLWLWAPDVDRYLERVHERPGVVVETVDRVDGGALCTVERVRGTDEPWLFDLFDEVDATVLSAAGDDEWWSFRVRTSERGDLGRLQRVAGAVDINVSVDAVQRLSGAVTVQTSLTDCQRRTLIAAYNAGYYDTPRRATLADFGEEFDITPRAVSQRLRRGVGNLVSATLPVD